MQWSQLDDMQTICTLLQTHNHINTPLLFFSRPDALPNAQPTVAKHRRQSNVQNLLPVLAKDRHTSKNKSKLNQKSA